MGPDSDLGCLFSEDWDAPEQASIIRFSSRASAGEAAQDVVARHRDQLGEIADQHPGETVLVLAHRATLRDLAPVVAHEVREWDLEWSSP